MDRRLGGPQIWSGRYEEENVSWARREYGLIASPYCHVFRAGYKMNETGQCSSYLTHLQGVSEMVRTKCPPDKHETRELRNFYVGHVYKHIYLN
jgi:hypothetical protein